MVPVPTSKAVTAEWLHIFIIPNSLNFSIHGLEQDVQIESTLKTGGPIKFKLYVYINVKI